MRSGFERKIAAQLRKAKVKFKYEQFSYEYEDPMASPKTRCRACGSTEIFTTRFYTPDFFLENGIIIETKGKFTARNRRTMLAVRESHPNEDIRLLFMRDNKLSKASKTKYSDWAKANGYQYAVGSVPPSWLTK